MESIEENKRTKNEILGKIMLKVSSFPSMPQAGTKLMSLLNRPDVDIGEVEKTMRYEPGLTANVLKLANSSYFGIPARVGSLKHGIMLLGTQRFSQIVLSACIHSTMGKAVDGYEIPPGELWQHSVAVSKSAEALAKVVKLDEGVDVFTPALLHDMGKLALGMFVKEESAAIASIASNGVPMVVAENMILGTDHAEIGARILADWSFPAEIVNAVRWHHNPERVKNSNKQTELIYLANILCHSTDDDDSIGNHEVTPSSVVLKRLGISLNQYMSILERAGSWMKELSGRLKLD